MLHLVQRKISYFWCVFAHFDSRRDCSIKVLGPLYLYLRTLFLLYNFVAEFFGFPTTKWHLHNNLPMHTAIFNTVTSEVGVTLMVSILWQPSAIDVLLSGFTVKIFSLMINSPIAFYPNQCSLQFGCLPNSYQILYLIAIYTCAKFQGNQATHEKVTKNFQIE